MVKGTQKCDSSTELKNKMFSACKSIGMKKKKNKNMRFLSNIADDAM